MKMTKDQARELQAIVGAVEDARCKLESLRDELQAYSDERSERWHDTDAGEDYAEDLDKLTEAVDVLETTGNELLELQP